MAVVIDGVARVLLGAAVATVGIVVAPAPALSIPVAVAAPRSACVTLGVVVDLRHGIVVQRGFLTLLDGSHDADPATGGPVTAIGTLSSGTVVLAVGTGFTAQSLAMISSGTIVAAVGERRGRAIERNWTGFEGGRNDVSWSDAAFASVVRDGSARSGDYYCRHTSTTPLFNQFQSAWARRDLLLGTALAVGEQARTVMRVFVRLRAHVGTTGCHLCGVYVYNGQAGMVALDTTGHFAAVAGLTIGPYSSAALVLHRWYRVDVSLTVTQGAGATATTDTVVSISSAAGVLVETVTCSVPWAGNATLPRDVTIGQTHPTIASTFAYDFDDWVWASGEMSDVPDVQLPTLTRIIGVPVTGQGPDAAWSGPAAAVSERPRDTTTQQTSATAGATTTFLHAPAATLGLTAIAGVVLRANLSTTGASGTDALLFSGVAIPVTVPNGIAQAALDAVFASPIDLAAFAPLTFGARNLRGVPLVLDNIYLEVLGQAVRVYTFRVRHDNLSIHHVMGEAPTTLSLTVDGERPPGSAAVRIGLEPGTLKLAATIAGSEAAAGTFDLDGEPLLFEGVFQTVEEHYDDGLRVHLGWDCTAIDHVYELNKLRPFGSFDAVAAHVVIETIMGTAAPGFDLSFVQQIAVPITIAFDGALETSACLTKIATQLGSCHWYLDFFALHFYHLGINDGDVVVSANPPPPPPLTPPTRSTVPFSGSGGYFGDWAFLSLTFVYSNGLESQPSDSLLAFIAQPGDEFCLDFTDLPLGAPFNGLPVVKRYLYLWMFEGSLHGGGQPRVFFIIPDNTQTTYRLDVSVAPFQYRVAPLRYDPAPAPTTALAFTTSGTITLPYTGFGAYNVRFAVAFLYETGLESPLGPWSAAVAASGNEAVFTLTGLPIGLPNADGKAVRLRTVYVSFLSGTTWSDALGLAFIPNNTATAWDLANDGAATLFADGGPVGSSPLTHYAFYKRNAPTGPGATFGPSLEDDLEQPDPLIDDSSTLLHEDPPLTSSEDDTQVRTRVFVTGASSPLTLATAAVSDGFNVGSVAIYDAGGGQVVVDGEIFAYTSITSGILWFPAGVTAGRVIPIGTPVSLWVQCDDYQAQGELGAREAVDDVPTDGVREFAIVDTSLATVQDCLARGYAELTLWARPILTVNYATFDRKTRAGRLVPINLTHPPLVHPGLLIQEVTIDRIDVGAVPWPPRYSVTASSVRFTLDDLLRKVQLSDGS